MTSRILEFLENGIHVLPLQYKNDKFIHPNYSHKFDTGFTERELSDLIDDGYTDGIAVMHGKCNADLVCLDFDEKNAPGKNLFDTWCNIIDPYIYKKLVVERTRSSGYHVYFLCKTLPPEKALASSIGNEEWIAARSSKSNGITYCAPSPRYTEMQGCLLYDLQELTRQEMMELCDAATQLNEYNGAVSAKGTQLPAVVIPSQFSLLINIFDKKVPESFTIDYLVGLGWSTDGQTREKRIDGVVWDYVKMWRPGRSQDEPYSANYWIKNKRISVFTSSTPMPDFQSGGNFSHRPSDVLYYNMGRDWQSVYNKVLELCEQHGIAIPEPTPMAYFIQMGKSLTWKVEVKGVLEWAERMGYRWMPISGTEASVVQMVRVVDNVIYEVDDKDILRAFRLEIEKNHATEPDTARCLTNFMPSLMSYMNALPVFDMPLMRDDKDTAYLYFANGALRITKSEATLLRYSELEGCVFAKHIKNFDYREVSDHGVFGQFIDKIVEDEAHKNFLMSGIGYMLHYHKLRNYAKALMLIEDVEDQEEARGRSGKGLLAQFIEWLRWVVQQDGRNYKSDSQFKMQRIVPGVQVYYLNDPAPGVLMNQFYNFITDDWLVESKGKKAYSIPFIHSPKILITTNFLPNLESDSDKDRFIKMPIKKVFGSTYAVRDAFPNVIFFEDNWRQQDALGAVRFGVDCLQLYLGVGVTAYNNDRMNENANRRVISNLVPTAIIETMEQAVECWAGSKNNDEFLMSLGVVDMRKDMPESLKKCFSWEPGSLIIYVSKLYLYCRSAYNMKDINDKLFSRRVRTWLDKSGFSEVLDFRNHHTGRRLEVGMNTQKRQEIGLDEVKLSTMKKNTNMLWRGVEGDDITDF